MRTHATRLTLRRNARREAQLAPLAAWQARKYLASQVTLLDADFDGEAVLPPTAAEHYRLHEWLRHNRPLT
jgi:hypothetical protein